MRRRRAVLTTIALSYSGLAGCSSTRIGEFDTDDGASEDRHREIVVTYEDSLTARNEGIESRDTGVGLFNAEEYTDAIERFNSARSSCEDAEAGFAEAAEIAVEAGRSGARTICETAREETATQIEATEAALAAATAAEEGADASTINEHVTEFQEIEAEASALTVEDTEVLAETLGLQ